MAINKVELNNADGTKNTLIDLTQDTVTSSTLAKGYKAHGSDGEEVIGALEVKPIEVYEDEFGNVVVDGASVILDDDVIIDDVNTSSNSFPNNIGINGFNNYYEDKTIEYPTDAPDIFSIDIPDDMTKSVVYFLYKRTPDGFISILSSLDSCKYEVGYLDESMNFNIIDTVVGTSLKMWYPQDYEYVVVRITLNAVGNIRLDGSPVPTFNGMSTAISFALQQLIAIYGSIPTFSSVGTGANNTSFVSKHTKKVKLKNATNKLTSLQRAFQYGYSITDIDLVNFDTSNVTTMYAMFDQEASLTRLDLSGFDIRKVTDFSYFLAGCRKLTTLKLDGWQFDSAKNLTYMFSECENLVKIPVEVEMATFSNVTNLSYMFNNCFSLKSLDVSNWNVSKVTTFTYMFYYCHSLESLDTSNWVNSVATTTANMFYYCQSLHGVLDLSGLTGEKITSVANMFPYCRRITKIKLNNFALKVCTTCASMFEGCRSLIDIECDFTKWDVSKITTLSKMFNACLFLTSLNLSGWNLLACTTIDSIFYGCINVTELDVSNWNLPVCKTFSSACRQLWSLKSLDLSTWNVVAPTSMTYMFFECYSLKDLKLSKTWTTENVTNLSYMFGYCSSLERIPEEMSSWNLRKVTTIAYMFEYCTSLIDADISDWNIGEKITTIMNIFINCNRLTKINLSGLSFPFVTDARNIFTTSTTVWYVNFDGIELPSVTSTTYYFNPNYEGLIEYYPFKIYHSCSCNITSISYESLLRVLDALVPLASGVTKTITFGANRYRLTQEQLAIATSKGWTVA